MQVALIMFAFSCVVDALAQAYERKSAVSDQPYQRGKSAISAKPYNRNTIDSPPFKKPPYNDSANPFSRPSSRHLENDTGWGSANIQPE